MEEFALLWESDQLTNFLLRESSCVQSTFWASCVIRFFNWILLHSLSVNGRGNGYPKALRMTAFVEIWIGIMLKPFYHGSYGLLHLDVWGGCIWEVVCKNWLRFALCSALWSPPSQHVCPHWCGQWMGREIPAMLGSHLHFVLLLICITWASGMASRACSNPLGRCC